MTFFDTRKEDAAVLSSRARDCVTFFAEAEVKEAAVAAEEREVSEAAALDGVPSSLSAAAVAATGAEAVKAGAWEEHAVANHKGKWMAKRPRARLQAKGAPWLGVRDTVWAVVWQQGQHQRGVSTQTGDVSWVARSIAKQLTWQVKDSDKWVDVKVEMYGDVWRTRLYIHEDDEPSLVLGDDAIRAMVAAGYALATTDWGDQQGSIQPVVEDGAVIHEEEVPELVSGSDSEWSDDSDGEGTDGSDTGDDGDEEHWRQLVSEHQRLAVHGDEPGGLITGGEWDVPGEVMREAVDWDAEEERLMGVNLEAGPGFETPDTNPEQFKNRADEYLPEHIHTKVQEWWDIQPRCDSEVLRWIENKIRVRMPESARGAQMKNGRAALAEPKALMQLMKKRLKNRTWSCVAQEKLVSLIQLNLQPKPSAEPPWRLTVWPKDANEGLSKWSVRYEGLKKLALVVTRDCWLISIDLESGYDAMGLHEETKPWFGARFYATKEFIEELEAEGLLVEGCLGQRDAKGGAEVFIEPNTLPQGFSWACAIFTKVVRQMVRQWRAEGIRCCHLIDDLLLAFDSYVMACWGRDYVLDYLQAKGWFVSWMKAVLTPHQRTKFLGMVVDVVAMRFFLPASKVEKIEVMLDRVLADEGKGETNRSLAVVVGNLIATDMALPAVRMYIRSTCTCIRPEEGEWDNKVQVSAASLDDLAVVRRRLRLWNTIGGPIRKMARMCDMRIILDASVHGYGYRCDGRLTRDVKWDGRTKAVAAEWVGSPLEHQVHREMAAVVATVQREVRAVAGRAVLLETDCKAVETYVNEGTGSSTVLAAMAKELWQLCARHGIRLRAEHMAGARMVAAGVDSCSRASEFSLAWKEFQQLQRSATWGQRWGFNGFTVDLCASQKTKKCKQYYSRGGEGKGSLGDMRTAHLDVEEFYYVVPPVGMIEATVQLLEEAKVAAVVIVPLWTGREWSLYLRERAEEVQVMPWRSHPAVWLDVSEKKPKQHVVASQWEFMVVAVDWRRGAQVRATPLPAPKRWTDHLSQPQFEEATRRRWAHSTKPGGQGYPQRGSRGARTWYKQRWPQVQRGPASKQREYVVLSLCGGMGTEAVALQRVFKIFGVELKVRVLAIEVHQWARRIASGVAGDTVQHLEPHDLWDWVRSEEELDGRLQELGEVHATVMGYSCQDVSTAYKTGKGLRGPKSSVFFAGRMLVDKLKARWPKMMRVYECTWFQHKHPRDWSLVAHLLGMQAQCMEAALVAPARRKRAIWADCELLPLQRQEEVIGAGRRDVGAATCLEGDRRPAHRWVEKMPTVMSSGPRSWNMKHCVVESRNGRWRKTHMRITEVESAMGWWKDATKWVDGDVPVPEEERWRAVGNGIQLGVMAHIWVSALVTQGYITRDDVRQKGQIWTVNQDGPTSVQDAVAELRKALKTKAKRIQKRELPVERQGPPKSRRQSTKQRGGRKRRGSSERGGEDRQAKAPRREIRERWGLGGVATEQRVVRMSDVYQQVDKKGVPKLRHMTREVRKEEAKKTKTSSRQEHRELLRQLVIDGLVMAKSEKTWQSYAAWWAVFGEYGDMEGVELWSEDSATVEEQAALLQQALADLFYHGQYAVSSLKLMVTAVCSRIKDTTGRSVRQEFPELTAQLEGYERKEGRATRKKQPTTEEHVGFFMAAPGGPWTGRHGSLKWVQWVAVVCTAWQGFLRKQEIRNLDLCDMVWHDKGATMTVRQTKNDKKSYTRSVEMAYDADKGDECMLTCIKDYVVEMHGSANTKPGCTKEKRPAESCAA